MLATEAPFPQYFDTDGSPLDGGKLYFGLPNQDPETNPIPVYWDAAGTQPAAQPIRTINGYTARAGTPANVFVAGDYSINARNKKGELAGYWKTLAEDFHWHIEILPILEKRSKSYSIKEVYFNSLLPEQAAEQLRALDSNS